MGYYTHYTLDYRRLHGKAFRDSCEHAGKYEFLHLDFCPECGIERGNVRIDKDIFSYIADDEQMRYVIINKESAEWYEHKKDMLKMSAAFPGWLFTLECHGEEDDDIWREYYLNGASQLAKAKITFEEFDEKKLK